MNKPPRIILTLIILVLVLQPSATVFADIAPPSEPPGSNIDPGEEITQVQMVREKVVIDLSNPPLDETDLAHVVADFTMRNQGKTAEQMQVRFPINGDPRTDETTNYETVYPLLRDFAVRVEGDLVSTEVITVTDSEYHSSWGYLVYWATFDVTFPAGKDVDILVSYNLQPTYGQYGAEYLYILGTGAGWQGSIGIADIFLRMPYDVNRDNYIYFDYGPEPTFDHNVAYWRFENFEPTYMDNIEIQIVPPIIWQEILALKAQLEENPEDAEVLGQLAKKYWEAAATAPKGRMRFDEGGVHLAHLCMDAYEQAINLRPLDVNLRLEYIDMLRDEAVEDVDIRYQKTIEQLKAVFAIDPQNERARKIVIYEMYPSPKEILPPTLTPDPRTPSITPIPSLTPKPTQTHTNTATRTPTASPKPSLTGTNTASPTLTRTKAPTQTPDPTATTKVAPSPTKSPTRESSATATPAVHTGRSYGPIALIGVIAALIVVVGALAFELTKKRK